jgi:signal transduction histidine kinase
MKSQSIPQYFAQSLLRYAGAGLFLLFWVALGVSFVLTRDQMSTDLQESATAIAHAFHDRIIDGDIRSVEPQLKQLLNIREGESAQILNHDLTRVYRSFSDAGAVKPCPNVDITCYESLFGQARVFVPVSLSNTDDETSRYLYISRQVRLNWGYFITVFFVFALGYLGLAIAFMRISKVTSTQISDEILKWSDRLKSNPKDAAPSVEPPFAELKPLRQALEGLNTQIDQFEKTATDKARFLLLRGIAHDLLSPVSRLQRYIGVLSETTDQTTHGDIIAEIEDSLNIVTGIASQVKTLKDLEVSVEETELVSAAQQEVRALSGSKAFTEKSIELEFRSSASNIMAPFSRTEIARIITNLVQNAADASHPGAQINITVGQDAGRSFLSVSDRGCGIPEDARSRVFDPNFTLKPGTGTGLGLAIVKYICDRRSAQIELDTKVNSGTTVTIRLPEVGGSHV